MRKYHGTTLNEERNINQEIKSRIEQTRRTFSEKYFHYVTYICSILLYN